MNKIAAFLVVISCTTAMAQSGKLKRANNFYAHLSYYDASKIYEELIGTKADNAKMKESLAMCYYQMGDMTNAEKYFYQLIPTNDLDKRWYYYFAQSLKQNGKYTESDLWMAKFQSSFPNDLRGLSFANDKSYYQTITTRRKRYTTHNLSVNSQFADFGGYTTAENKVFFLSARKDFSTVYREWSWNGKRFLNLYIAKKDSTNELSKARYFNRKTNSRFHEGPLCFSPDGKVVYFTRNNISKGKSRKDKKGIQNLKLYSANLKSKGRWENEKALALNSADFSVGHPTITKDGKWLYFASDMPGGFGGADLYKAEILNDGTLGKPSNLGKYINTEGNEMFPWFSDKGELYFSSDGLIGLGGLDVFKAIISANGSIKIENLGPEINSRRDDFAFILNKDGKTGYFSSNRDGGKGDDDIYKFEYIEDLILKGVLSVANSNTVIPNALVQLKDKDGKVIAETHTDNLGAYSFIVDPDKEYTVTFIANNFESKSYNVSTQSKKSGDIIQDGQLEKIPVFDLNCLVTDASTNKPIENAFVLIKAKNTGEIIINTTTTSTGDITKLLENKKVNDVLDYEITISKEGYVSKKVDFYHTITQPGTIKIHEQLALNVSKIKLGMDLASIIDINPIYFDLGKYAIRPDAAKELDKIVKIMNEYPTIVVELGSHTDCRSSIAFNKKLSDNRAKASAAYIKSRITKPERIYGKGYGESKLKVNCPCEGKVVSNCSEDEHQKNRRTEFIIVKM